MYKRLKGCLVLATYYQIPGLVNDLHNGCEDKSGK